MIITSQYILVLVLSIFLTLLAWGLEASWLVKKTRPDHFKSIRNITVTLLVVLLIWLAIMNFAATLTVFVFGCGIVAFIDLFFRKKRIAANIQEPLIVENARSFFLILLIVWVIRSFIVQPYRVPTGSLQPTVRPGDFLIVNQFAYGFRFPVINKTMIEMAEPKRGEIVLFYYPVDPSIVFVKRVIGLPGDHIEYKNKVLFVNGEEMTQTDLGTAIDSEPKSATTPEEHIPVFLKEEDLDGVKHEIYIAQGQPNWFGNFAIDVPEGQYFMIGDNRDNSDDSRSWGFVPEENLIGKAFGIWMSWDSINNSVRWNRIGKGVK